MVLWSVRKTSLSHEAFVNAGGYMVNVLGAQQKDVALKFAQGTQAERFADQSLVRGLNQHPRLDGVIAWFDCRIAQVVSAGDHDILIGKVLDYLWHIVLPVTALAYRRHTQQLVSAGLDRLVQFWTPRADNISPSDGDESGPRRRRGASPCRRRRGPSRRRPTP